MVIHSSPGSRRRKKALPKEEVKKTVAKAKAKAKTTKAKTAKK